MKSIIIPALVFVAIMAFAAFVAWCGGFNFDARKPDVGFAVMLTSMFAAAIAMILHGIIKQS